MVRNIQSLLSQRTHLQRRRTNNTTSPGPLAPHWKSTAILPQFPRLCQVSHHFKSDHMLRQAVTRQLRNTAQPWRVKFTITRSLSNKADITKMSQVKPDVEGAKKYIDSYTLFVTSLTYCPDAKAAKEILQKALKDFTTEPFYLELDTLQNGAELRAGFKEITGSNWVPQIWINGNKFGTEQTLKEHVKNKDLELVLRKAGLE